MAKDIKVFADIMEPEALAQAHLIADHPCIEGPIRIMPDAHAGAGCVIGFTGRFDTGIVPNVVGVDIGCGVSVKHYKLLLSSFLYWLEVKYHTSDRTELFKLLDKDIRDNVPTGSKCRSTIPYFLQNDKQVESLLQKAENILKKISPNKYIDPKIQLGTLGGGNHFIEINRFEKEEDGFCIVVHSGSRNLGHKIGTYFQNKAKELAQIIKSNKSEYEEICKIFKEVSPDVPNGLEYLPYVDIDSEAYVKYPEYTGNFYMECAHVAQEYASLNRKCIMEFVSNLIPTTLNFDSFESIHNYIDSDGITRKGAIRAMKDEKVVIPLSMKDGIIIGAGKGNSDWNYSAPHGAGRIAGRSEMKKRLEAGDITMEDFQKDMEGIYTSSVVENTIDESSFAYKPAQEIINAITPTVDIQYILKPLFNLKDIEVEGYRKKKKRNMEDLS